jgi:hypothetical protein
MSFHYYPQATKVADPYQNYSTGGTKYVLDEHAIVQFKSDTDQAFRSVATQLQTLEAQIHQFKAEGKHIRDENIALKRMLDWVNFHYPEAIHALDTTMKVTVKLDEANDYGDAVMEAP